MLGSNVGLLIGDWSCSKEHLSNCVILKSKLCKAECWVGWFILFFSCGVQVPDIPRYLYHLLVISLLEEDFVVSCTWNIFVEIEITLSFSNWNIFCVASCSLNNSHSHTNKENCLALPRMSKAKFTYLSSPKQIFSSRHLVS